MSVLLLRRAAVADVEDAAALVVVAETPEDPPHLRNHPECFSSRLTRHPSRRPRPQLLLQQVGLVQQVALVVVEVAQRLRAVLPVAVAEMPEAVVAVAVNVAVVAVSLCL